MNIHFLIFLFTFLIFPIISIVIYQYVQFEKIAYTVISLLLFFLTFDTLYFFGISFKGDCIDYFIFSLEFFAVHMSLCIKPTSTFTRVLANTGRISVVLGITWGLIGLFFSPVLYQDFQFDKVYHFNNGAKQFETRRYAVGFVSFESTEYTFETYLLYGNLPVEKRIDKTVLLDTKTDIMLNELTISILKKKETLFLVFKDLQAKSITKAIK